MKATLKLVAAFLFRWFHFPVEPGLRIFGTPNEHSPVFLTANFVLTLKRLSKYLKGLDCYLLVAPTKGINVWCAAGGGDFTAHSVISVIKTSDINKRVKHRTLIAPQLSAPGIDPKKVRNETGWQIKFGPVYAKDILQYIKTGFKKTKEMQLVKFPLRARLEMATSYYVTMILVLTLPLIIFFSELYLSLITWAGIIVYGMYIAFPYLPPRSGFVKAGFSAVICLVAIVGLSMWTTGKPFSFSHLLIMAILVVAVIGFDFNGTSPTYKSDLGALFYRHGHQKFPFLTGVYSLNPYGKIQINKEACSGCTLCDQVCPRGVYEMDPEFNKANLVHPESCINCNACVYRCPEQCLAIV